MTLFGRLKPLLDSLPNIRLGVLRHEYETEGGGSGPNLPLSIGWGSTRYNRSKHEGWHIIEPGADLWFQIVTRRAGSYLPKDFRSAIVRITGLKVGESDAEFVEAIEGDEYANSDSEIWYMKTPLLGKQKIVVTGLVDARGNPVVDGFVEWKSVAFDLKKQYDWQMLLDFEWLKIPLSQRGGSGWVLLPPLTGQRSTSINVRPGLEMIRPLERPRSKIERFVEAYRIPRLVQVYRVWQVWRANGEKE